ncbi:uncharacterized protein LOC110861707 isoform X2 [Folsomia candida]|uniref:uncharacterized protein LOC110861707 isoform X2 n=1 Tax=Folsomia candida TaxID=158441 RepID=UPI000B8F85DD|nr:uncharacterized protein LOC110861707 isoform X2 [Folsomia candida]
MHPTTYFFLAYSLIFAVSEAQEDCSLTDEAVKVMKDAFKIFFPDKPFLTCLLDGPCDPKKFKLPQAPTCGIVVRDGPLLKNLNITQLDRFLENFIYSAGGDAEEICSNLWPGGDKLLAMSKKYLEGSLINNLCPQGNAKHPTGCKDVEQEDVGAPFTDLSKFIRNTVNGSFKTVKSKGSKLLVGGAIGQRIKSLFGGGDLGRNVAKCINEIITITTKGGKLFVCKLGKCD